MKWICRCLKAFQIFIGAVAVLVAFDMLFLGGSIKLWIIAVANTTSASPFSSDGQSNWMLLLVMLNVSCMGCITYYMLSGRDFKKRTIYLMIVLFILSIIMLAVMPGLIIN